MLNVFLDTETTGLDPMRHRVIEIAFKVVESHEVIVSYEAIIRLLSKLKFLAQSCTNLPIN